MAMLRKLQMDMYHRAGVRQIIFSYLYYMNFTIKKINNEKNNIRYSYGVINIWNCSKCK